MWDDMLRESSASRSQSGADLLGISKLKAPAIEIDSTNYQKYVGYGGGGSGAGPGPEKKQRLIYWVIHLGQQVFRKRVYREGVLKELLRLPRSCAVELESCRAAHYWSREIMRLGLRLCANKSRVLHPAWRQSVYPAVSFLILR